MRLQIIGWVLVLQACAPSQDAGQRLTRSQSEVQVPFYFRHWFYVPFDGVEISCSELANAPNNPAFARLLAPCSLVPNSNVRTKVFPPIQVPVPVRENILTLLRTIFQAYEHSVTIADYPPPTGPYSTLLFYVPGMTEADVTVNFGTNLVSPNLDCGNLNFSDMAAVILSNEDYTTLVSETEDFIKVSMAQKTLAVSAAHQIGRLLGLLPVHQNLEYNSAVSIMNESITLWVTSSTIPVGWSNGLIPTDNEFPSRCLQGTVATTEATANGYYEYNLQAVLAEALRVPPSCEYLASELFGWRLLHVQPASLGTAPISWADRVDRNPNSPYKGWQGAIEHTIDEEMQNWLAVHGWRLHCAAEGEEAIYDSDNEWHRLDEQRSYRLDPGNQNDIHVKTQYRYGPFDWTSPVERTWNCAGGCYMFKYAAELTCDGCSANLPPALRGL